MWLKRKWPGNKTQTSGRKDEHNYIEKKCVAWPSFHGMEVNIASRFLIALHKIIAKNARKHGNEDDDQNSQTNVKLNLQSVNPISDRQKQNTCTIHSRLL